MSLFSRRPSFQEGLETFQKTPGAVLLDVRTPEEFAAGHVPEAVNAPLDALERIDYQQDTPLFVYCHSGARSASSAWLAPPQEFSTLPGLKPGSSAAMEARG